MIPQMDLELTSAPAATCVTLTEAKAHLRVEHTDEDTMITSLISAATGMLDGKDGLLRRALVTQTWKYRLKEFPWSDRIYLPLPPLQSVTAITYYDVDNALQTLSSSDYAVNVRSHIGYVRVNPTASWPGTYDRDDAVIIEYVAGYGNAAAVPMPIKQAVLLIIGELYAERGDVVDSKVMSAGSNIGSHARAAAERLLRNYRVHQWSLAA